MEGLQDQKLVSEEVDYFCKLDLKALFYRVPVEKKTQRNIFELLSLYFGLGFVVNKTTCRTPSKSSISM